MGCSEAVLDGELIALNEEGKPSFSHVMSRERVQRKERLKHYQRKYPVQYMIFDILFRDGMDLRQIPLVERKRILEQTINGTGLIQVVSDYRDGEALFSAMKDKGMEGIVSKHINSPYLGGKKHREWFKTKVKKRLLCVVCGVKLKSREIKSLILGIYENERLIPVGHVSSGLSTKDKTILSEAIPQLQQKESPWRAEQGKGYALVSASFNRAGTLFGAEPHGDCGILFWKASHKKTKGSEWRRENVNFTNKTSQELFYK